MAKPPLPIIPPPQPMPDWFQSIWTNLLLDWQFLNSADAGNEFILNQIATKQTGGAWFGRVENGANGQAVLEVDFTRNNSVNNAVIYRAMTLSVTDAGTGTYGSNQAFRFGFTKAAGAAAGTDVCMDIQGLINENDTLFIAFDAERPVIAGGKTLTTYRAMSMNFLAGGVTNPYGLVSAAGLLHGFATLTPNQTIDNAGAQAARGGAITLANGVNSNIAPANSVPQRITGPTVAFSVGGFSGGTDGRELEVYNTVNQTMTIVNNDAGSSAGNKILTLTGANVVLRANLPSYASLRWYTTDNAWVLRSTN